MAETDESSPFLFIVLFCVLLFLVRAGKDAGKATKRWGIGGRGMEASLLSQGPVYHPPTTPVFDLLTAADGKDMSLKLKQDR